MLQDNFFHESSCFRAVTKTQRCRGSSWRQAASTDLQPQKTPWRALPRKPTLPVTWSTSRQRGFSHPQFSHDVKKAWPRASSACWRSPSWHQAAARSRRNPATGRLLTVLRWVLFKVIELAVSWISSSERSSVQKCARHPFHLQLHASDQARGWGHQERGKSERWGENWYPSITSLVFLKHLSS